MNNVPWLLSVFGYGKAAAIVAICFSLYWFVWPMIQKQMDAGGEKPVTKQATCSCGWSGNVSSVKPICPKCGKAIG